MQQKITLKNFGPKDKWLERCKKEPQVELRLRGCKIYGGKNQAVRRSDELNSMARSFGKYVH